MSNTATASLNRTNRLLCSFTAHFAFAFVLILAIGAQLGQPTAPTTSVQLDGASGLTITSSNNNLQQPRQQVADQPLLKRPQQQQQQQQHVPPTSRQANLPFATTAAGGGAKSNERFNLIEADENGLYLLGLFDIHQSNPRVPFKCGQIDLDAGEWQSRRPMQNMEAFLWAIEQVNADKSILPGIRLGSLVMDTCSSFLRTNQQLANLLHQPQQQFPSVRQIMGIVADNADPHSLEAVVGMASSLGLTTFVTQSRSTKLSELASKYTNISVPSAASSSQVQPSPQAHPLENVLGDLLGIGRMMPDTPLSPMSAGNPADEMAMRRQKDYNSSSRSIRSARDARDERASLAEQLGENSSRDSARIQQQQQQQQEKLLMVRMLLGNELLAEALATLLQQMGWDFVSLIYDDEPDMVDLHDELTRQMFSRTNTQLALDEQVSFSSSTPSELVFDRLLQNLAKKSQFGAKVVITLLGTGSARLLLDSLNHLRSSSSSSTQQQAELISQVNSLLWITVSDREPYYSFATDALGTISISSSVSLLPKFKSYYDHLINDERRPSDDPHSTGGNKWWPEYMRAILVKHRKEIELLSNECAKWLEPRSSLLNEKCRSLTLSSLVQVEKLSASTSVSFQPSSSLPARTSQPNKSSGNKSKLAKYLAAGWEHNGMDVIDSVAAIANGLEYIRQALCPESVSGLCERMREFIVASPLQTATSNSAPDSANKPTLSELIYEELLRSTFQQADGRLFNMDEFSLLGGQVEGKFRLYNLRYLQPNSIGFVRFGQFEQQEGLVLNGSKARHYPSGANFKDQVGVEQVKSSCQDERKCLMLSTLELASMNKQTISEEEAALGVNSLFKLDHPALVALGSSGGSAASSGGAELASNHPAAAAGGGVINNNNSRQQQQQAVVRQVLEDPHIHTMRPAKQTSSAFYHNWPAQSTSATNSSAPQTRAASSGANGGGSLSNSTANNNNKLTFNAIVLLPLHRRARRRCRQQAAAEYQSSSEAACSPQLDMERSFQHLVALAYALNTAEAAATAADSKQNRQQQVELTTTVIDYCEQVELAENKLALKLTSSEILQQELPVAIIDFDTKLSEHIDKLVGHNKNLLHLTIGAPKGLQASGVGAARSRRRHHDDDDDDANKQQHGASSFSAHNDDGVMASGRSRSQSQSRSGGEHLRVSLLPSKANEIQALVSLLASSSLGRDWRLVHLIYTDHHHYRDEFVRRANEANICVSKLIWIPTLDEEEDDHDDGGGQFCGQEEQQRIRLDRLNKTKLLFERELYDYSSPAPPYSSSSSSMGTGNSEAEGLNSTRILIVLASANDATNRLILAAASKSMLEDYVWLTTHEWLASVEMAAERQAPSYLDDQKQSDEGTNSKRQVAGLHFSTHTSSTGETRQLSSAEANKLPRLFISTRIESYLSGESYRRFFSSLTPAIHSPLPTSWLDEFWQQKFNCRLPISNNPSLAVYLEQQQLPVCKSNQHLDLHSLLQIEDDRVSYVIQAIESMYSALREQNLTKRSDFSPQHFGAKFKQTFKEKQQSKQTPKGKLLPNYFGGFSKLPYGFHFVHRLVPNADSQQEQSRQQQQSNAAAAFSRRRQNSRDLSPSQSGQLVKVGVWRDGELILLRKQNDTIFSWLNSPPADKSDESTTSKANIYEHEDDDAGVKVSKSLNRLSSVKSRCQAQSETCALCRQQIEQTKNQLKREEARLKQSESISEPKAISSIDLSNGSQQQQAGRANLAKTERQLTGGSILDSVPKSPFEESYDDDEEGDAETAASNGHDNDDDDEGKASNKDTTGKGSGNSIEQPRRRHHHQKQREQSQEDSTNGTAAAGQALDEIQASASSLFDAATSQQVEQQRLADLVRAHQAMMISTRHFSSCSARNADGSSRRNFIMSLLSVFGIIGTLLAMICFYPSMEANLLQLQGEDRVEMPTFEHEDKLSTVGSQSSLVVRQSNETKKRQRRGEAAAVAVNLADYILLAGLLMLNSISIAFLLPATMSVCWFRRIGLASSYTMMLSSILVKVLANYRRRRHHQSAASWASSRTKRADFASSNAHQSSATVGAYYPGSNLQQSQSDLLDPLEETIEVTFESLPHNCNEQPSSIVSNTEGLHSQQPAPAESSGEMVFTMSSSAAEQHLSNGYQTSTVPPTPNSASKTTAAGHTISQQSDHHLHDLCAKPTSAGGGDSMALSVCLALLLGQVLVSMLWLGQQPPEPTLFSGCWYCSSPLRAPLNFYFEPLLALLYPALLLALCWPLSLVGLRRAARHERQYKHALEKLQLNQRDGSHHFGAYQQQVATTRQTHATQLKLLQLAARVREAKSLVMTVTSLALIWAALTLTTISASRTNYQNPNSEFYLQQTRGEQTSMTKTIPSNSSNKTLALDEQTLVEANLVSGAIIFLFLFIYRLGLLALLAKACYSCIGCCFSCNSWPSTKPQAKSKRRNQRGQNQSVLTLNRQSSMASTTPTRTTATANNKWLDFGSDDFSCSADYFQDNNDSSATANSGQSERLGLQQFSSYGTYSHSPAFSAEFERNPTGSCRQFTTMNPLQAIVSSFGVGEPTTTATSTLETSSTGGNQAARASAKIEGKKNASAPKRRKSSLFGSLTSSSSVSAKLDGDKNKSSNKRTPIPKPRSINALRSVVGATGSQTSGESKLQRRQSTGSVASSTAQLVGAGDVGGNRNSRASSIVDADELYLALDDTISVASSSNSQLQGNDLYPIDCSLQLDDGCEFGASEKNEDGESSVVLAQFGERQATSSSKQLTLGARSSFGRQSLRRSFAKSNNKLSSVKEEQAQS